ncbi:MAG: GNAT family N-acetyltransferase [Paracoccaceae bacterium]
MPVTGERFEIRPVLAGRDGELVNALFQRAAGFVRQEYGREPSDDEAKEFFADAPVGQHPEDGVKLGLFQENGVLAGIADLAFGFPDPDCGYIGLLLLDPAHRGNGLGQGFYTHLEKLARARGAARLYLAVLDENADGQRFWQRNGFARVLTLPPVTKGARRLVYHRMMKPLA